MRIAHLLSIDAKGVASLAGYGSPDDMRSKFSEVTPPKGGTLEYWTTDRPRPKVKRGDPADAPKASKAHAEEEDEPKPHHHGKSKH